MSAEDDRALEGNGPHPAPIEEPVWALAAALTSAMTVDDIATAMAELGAPTAGAVFANLALLDPMSGRVRVTHPAILDPVVAERWATIELDDETPLGTAIIGGEAVLLESVDVVAERYPKLADDTTRAGLSATASLPLRLADGSVVGAVGFGWREAQPFGPAQTKRLHVIVDLATQAVERALRAERDRDQLVARDQAKAGLLHDVFLPTGLPTTAGLDVAAAFLPASGAPMGGDWYDAFPVDGGTCFVIGDVAGHGLSCVAAVGLLRNAIRAFADEDPSPARTLTRLNRLVCRLEPDVTATAIVAVWDPTRRSLLRSNAGHPPALLCRPGDVQFLDPPPDSMLLGVDEHWAYREERVSLSADTTILYYSDGLVEARDASLDDGMEALRQFVAKLPDLSPRRLSEAVLAWRTEGPARDDDLCILAIRDAGGPAS